MRYRQSISVPDLGVKIAPNVFNLPCITEAYKCNGHVIYELDRNVLRADPFVSKTYATAGDWLCEGEDGKWDILAHNPKEGGER